MNRFLKFIRRIQGVNTIQCEQHELRESIKRLEINQKEIININGILSQIKISGYYTLPFFGFFCSLFSLDISH